ncbi:putative Phosphoinositide 3-phosphatase [Blattamonas nauphoetae]|uniref:Phosphoinositide 3-phosphatase n=1 Tax=Blattamonas nauphoetae TaxID=2049346 RepID=A0ABQ9XD64_9EUKA|nr:putative Phosphoinositide 3-phosphatase [Blattamonas nauphoetae]
MSLGTRRRQQIEYDLLLGETLRPDGDFPHVYLTNRSCGGTIWITNYRMIFFQLTTRRSGLSRADGHVSFPLASISSVSKVGGKHSSGGEKNYHVEARLKTGERFRVFIEPDSNKRNSFYTCLTSAMDDIAKSLFCFTWKNSTNSDTISQPNSPHQSHLTTNLLIHFRLMGLTSTVGANSPSGKQTQRSRLRSSSSPGIPPGYVTHIRISESNKDFSMCPTYPPLVAVPSSISDQNLISVSSFRTSCRFPTISYLHPNGHVLCRSSQPRTGVIEKKSDIDSKMLVELGKRGRGGWARWLAEMEVTEGQDFETINFGGSGGDGHEDETSKHSTLSNVELPSSFHITDSFPSQTPLLIVDARPFAVAVGNGMLSGGWERARPGFWDVQFLGIENMKVMRKSREKLEDAMWTLSDKGEAVESTHPLIVSSQYLSHIHLLLSSARSLSLTLFSQSILVHCSDGWDRTPALITLTMILSHPLYRSFSGFVGLIEREWSGFGHRFGTRSGTKLDVEWTIAGLKAKRAQSTSNTRNEEQKGNRVRRTESHTTPRLPTNLSKSAKESQVSSIFVQFLDCVFQLLVRHSDEFGFRQSLLRFFAKHASSGLFGSFLCDCEAEREMGGIAERTESIWEFVMGEEKRRKFEKKRWKWEGVCEVGGEWSLGSESFSLPSTPRTPRMVLMEELGKEEWKKGRQFVLIPNLFELEVWSIHFPSHLRLTETWRERRLEEEKWEREEKRKEDEATRLEEEGRRERSEADGRSGETSESLRSSPSFSQPRPKSKSIRFILPSPLTTSSETRREEDEEGDEREEEMEGGEGKGSLGEEEGDGWSVSIALSPDLGKSQNHTASHPQPHTKMPSYPTPTPPHLTNTNPLPAQHTPQSTPHLSLSETERQSSKHAGTEPKSGKDGLAKQHERSRMEEKEAGQQAGGGENGVSNRNFENRANEQATRGREIGGMRGRGRGRGGRTRDPSTRETDHTPSSSPGTIHIVEVETGRNEEMRGGRGRGRGRGRGGTRITSSSQTPHPASESTHPTQPHPPHPQSTSRNDTASTILDTPSSQMQLDGPSTPQSVAMRRRGRGR